MSGEYFWGVIFALGFLYLMYRVAVWIDTAPLIESDDPRGISTLDAVNGVGADVADVPADVAPIRNRW